jgi:hypothetical protein
LESSGEKMNIFLAGTSSIFIFQIHSAWHFLTWIITSCLVFKLCLTSYHIDVIILTFWKKKKNHLSLVGVFECSFLLDLRKVEMKSYVLLVYSTPDSMTLVYRKGEPEFLMWNGSGSFFLSKMWPLLQKPERLQATRNQWMWNGSFSAMPILSLSLSSPS